MIVCSLIVFAKTVKLFLQIFLICIILLVIINPELLDMVKRFQASQPTAAFLKLANASFDELYMSPEDSDALHSPAELIFNPQRSSSASSTFSTQERLYRTRHLFMITCSVKLNDIALILHPCKEPSVNKASTPGMFLLYLIDNLSVLMF